MQFLWSPLLVLVALVPLLLVVYIWMQIRRRKVAVRYASLALVKPALDSSRHWRRYLPPALFFLALTLMLIALARPVALVRTPKQEGIVMLAIDMSLSMSSNDLLPSRFEAARAAARTFVAKRAGDADVGLVAFAGNAAIVQMPTTDENALDAAINTLFLQRGTAIGEGIVSSLDAIALSIHGVPSTQTGNVTPDSTASTPDITAPTPQPVPTLAPVPPGTYIPAVIVLLTDGNNRNGINPMVAAKMAADSGVRVFTVGVGGVGGVSGNQRSSGGGFGGNFGGGFGGGRFSQELDQTTLKAIADATGGEYFYAGNAADLEKIYSNLGLNVVLKLEKVELTVWFSAAAALLLLSAVALSVVWNAFN